MTKQKAMGLAFQIFGVYYFLQAIINMPVLWIYSQPIVKNFNQIFPYTPTAWITIFSLLSLIPGVILIGWGNSILLKNQGGSETQPLTKDWDQPIFALALRIIGAITIVEILPASIKAIISAAVYKNDYTQQFQRPTGTSGLDLLTGLALPLAISLFLLLKGDVLARVIFKNNRDLEEP
jgi:hypothetical protein